MLMRDKLVRSRLDAAAALGAYRDQGGMDEDDVTAIFDLVCDLMHLAEDRGVMPSEMPAYLARAENHWLYESDPDNAEEGV